MAGLANLEHLIEELQRDEDTLLKAARHMAQARQHMTEARQQAEAAHVLLWRFQQRQGQGLGLEQHRLG